MNATPNEDDRETRTTADRDELDDRRSDGAMSPVIRELILSYGDPDCVGPWDADAYTRRPVTTASQRAA